MSSSPDDFRTNPPAPSSEAIDDLLDPDGVPLDGVEKPPVGTPAVNAEPEPSLAELGEMYRVAPLEGGAEVSGEVVETKAEALERIGAARLRQAENTGKAKCALMLDNMVGFRAAYEDLIKARVEEAKALISNKEADFASGNFQDRGSSEDSSVREIFNSQVDFQKNEVDRHLGKLEILEQDLNTIIFTEGWDNLNKPEDVAYAIRGLILEAEKYQAMESRGNTFIPYNGELTGMLEMAISGDVDKSLMLVIKSAGERVAHLSPELKQKIAAL
jgi:hypothetical protein